MTDITADIICYIGLFCLWVVSIMRQREAIGHDLLRDRRICVPVTLNLSKMSYCSVDITLTWESDALRRSEYFRTPLRMCSALLPATPHHHFTCVSGSETSLWNKHILWDEWTQWHPFAFVSLEKHIAHWGIWLQTPRQWVGLMISCRESHPLFTTIRSLASTQSNQPTSTPSKRHIRQRGCGLAHKSFFFLYCRKVLIIKTPLETAEVIALEQFSSYWQVKKILQFGIHLDGQVIFPVYVHKDCTQEKKKYHWSGILKGIPVNEQWLYNVNWIFKKKLLKTISMSVSVRINMLHNTPADTDIPFTTRNWECKIWCEPFMRPFKNQSASAGRGYEGALRCSRGQPTRTGHWIFSEQEKGSATSDSVSLPFSRHMRAGLRGRSGLVFKTVTAAHWCCAASGTHPVVSTKSQRINTTVT